VAEESRATGYLETAFRERQDLAEQDQTAKSKEKSLLWRGLKDVGRTDFKQQKDVQHTQVKHVSRVGASQTRKPGAMGMATQRGSATSRGQASTGVKSPAKTEAQKRAASAASPMGYSAGGTAQLSQAQRWTAAGGQQAGPARDLSEFHIAHKVIDPYTPYKIFQKKKGHFGALSVSSFSPGGSGQQSVKGGKKTQRGTGMAGPPSMLQRRDSARQNAVMRDQERMKLSRKARLERYKKLIAPIHGDEGAQRVMAEFEKRDTHMFGEGGSGGTLSPALLWGKMETA